MSSVAFSSPRYVESGESGRFSSVHGSGFGVVFDNSVIVVDIGLKDTLSGDGISSLIGKGSEFLGPSSDSGVF